MNWNWQSWDWNKTLERSKTGWGILTSNRKNLLATIVLLAGLFIGSLFVDFGQLVTGSGFSGKAIRTHDTLVTAGKTWVAYTEPKVSLQVVNDPSCVDCDPSEALMWLRRIVPTLEAENIDVRSSTGEAIAKNLDLMTIPAFIFSEPVTQTEFFAEAEPLFRQVGQRYVFDMNKIGLPVGKYLTAPTTGEDEIILGNRDATVTLVIFSDFQCEYCREYHAAYKRVLEEYGDRVRIIFKHFPLPMHEPAFQAAEAAQCAAEQNQFLPYADILFSRQAEWSKPFGERRLKEYAWRVRGLNGRAFSQCLDENRYAEKVTGDIMTAEDFNIESVPTTFINREFVSGSAPFEDLKLIIEEELAR